MIIINNSCDNNLNNNQDVVNYIRKYYKSFENYPSMLRKIFPINMYKFSLLTCLVPNYGTFRPSLLIFRS